MTRRAFDVFRLAATIELALVLAEAAFPGAHVVLPLGCGHIKQVGLCFGFVYVLNEVRAVIWPDT